MAVAFITPEDLAPFATIEAAKADAMIADAEAKAITAAPCLDDPDTPLSLRQLEAVKATLRRAILRWNEVGTGVVTQQTAGPFGQSVDTTRTAPRGLFWPSEIAELQAICQTAKDRRVFTVDTGAHRRSPRHTPWCNLMMGGTNCSCGSYLTRYEYPLYETGPQ